MKQHTQQPNNHVSKNPAAAFFGAENFPEADQSKPTRELYLCVLRKHLAALDATTDPQLIFSLATAVQCLAEGSQFLDVIIRHEEEHIAEFGLEGALATTP